MNLAILILFTGILAAVVTGGICRQASRLSLICSPNSRSSHCSPTPHGGGLAIVIACTLVGIWLAKGQSALLLGAISLGAPLALLGLIDDIRPLPAYIRIVVHLALCAALLALLGGAPSPAPIGNLPFTSFILSSFVLLTGLWWTNLFNFMDGIDGLAGSQAVFMLLSGAVLGAGFHPEIIDSPVWIFMLCIAAATAGFLFFNWPPAKIFMGDVGSTWVGFMIFAVALFSIKEGWLDYAPWLVLSALFFTDASITLITRIVRRERWYEGHNSHAYQKLARRWGGHKPVTMLAIGINLLWLAPLAWACILKPEWALAGCILAYAPLIVGTIVVGAGRAEPVHTLKTTA